MWLFLWLKIQRRKRTQAKIRCQKYKRLPAGYYVESFTAGDKDMARSKLKAWRLRQILKCAAATTVFPKEDWIISGHKEKQICIFKTIYLVEGKFAFVLFSQQKCLIFYYLPTISLQTFAHRRRHVTKIYTQLKVLGACVGVNQTNKI